MPGIFNLTSPRDLLEKLSRELHRLRQEPSSVDDAFNFFTTAEHMLDWLHPGSAGRPQREALRSSDPLLALVHNVANGAKHFDKLGAHNRSVSSSSASGGFWARGLWAPGFWAHDFWKEPSLQISLQGDAALVFGPSITALDLAERTYAYWSTAGRVP